MPLIFYPRVPLHLPIKSIDYPLDNTIVVASNLNNTDVNNRHVQCFQYGEEKLVHKAVPLLYELT